MILFAHTRMGQELKIDAGQIGVAEKQVATGGGQASMSSPGITTTSMASGGDLHPSQGPAEAACTADGMPAIMQGLTDVQDGHQHEYYLTPVPEVGGFRVKSFTSRQFRSAWIPPAVAQAPMAISVWQDFLTSRIRSTSWGVLMLPSTSPTS